MIASALATRRRATAVMVQLLPISGITRVEAFAVARAAAIISELKLPSGLVRVGRRLARSFKVVVGSSYFMFRTTLAHRHAGSPGESVVHGQLPYHRRLLTGAIFGVSAFVVLLLWSVDMHRVHWALCAARRLVRPILRFAFAGNLGWDFLIVRVLSTGSNVIAGHD
jgi:hypothetical protein